MTTQTATDREKRLAEGISHSASRRFSSSCFQTLSFGGDFRFHFYYHLCQQFFALFLTVRVDISGVFFAVWPNWGVSALPQMVIDLGDAPGARFAALTLVSLEGAGSKLSGN